MRLMQRSASRLLFPRASRRVGVYKLGSSLQTDASRPSDRIYAPDPGPFRPAETGSDFLASADGHVAITFERFEGLRLLTCVIYPSKRRSTRQALCPPKPNELETAIRMSASRASFAM